VLEDGLGGGGAKDDGDDAPDASAARAGEDVGLERPPEEIGPGAVGMDLEGPQVVRPFADQLGLRFPVLIADDALRNGQTAFAKVWLLPTTLISGATDGW
jgi:hypothetical protein